MSTLAVTWYHLLFARWASLGVRTVVISPGYRDAPLIAALQKIPEMKLISCFDERAAGFLALGAAKTSGAPSVLICTSGTAGANYYPAVIEASKDSIPLLVVTADRPFELIHSGANQVMPQAGLFGSFARASLSFPEPTETLAPRTLVQYAEFLWQKAAAPSSQGPVHLNAPLREPLEPEHPTGLTPSAGYLSAVELARATFVHEPLLADLQLDASALGQLADMIRCAERGLLVVGRCQEREAIAALAQALRWPILLDVSARSTSFGASVIVDPETKAAEEALNKYRPDVVLHFGKAHISKWVDRVISTAKPKHYIVVSDSPDIQDQAKALTVRVQASPAKVAEGVAEILLASGANSAKTTGANATITQAAATLLHTSAKIRDAQKEVFKEAPFSFFGIAEALLQKPFTAPQLLIGNSTAIRATHVAASWLPETPEIVVIRGVSGIEGHVATAMGMVYGNGQPAALLVGDIALLHDVNSLFTLAQQQAPVLVVVVNNGGGGIFKKLPIGKFPDLLDPYLTTPHDFRFEGVATAAGIAYRRADDLGQLRDALYAFRGHPEPMLVECALNDTIDNLVQNALHQIHLS